MNEIVRHIPSFVDRAGPAERAAFETREQLLAIDFVRSWTEHLGFHQFSIDERLLIAEFRGGREWWVVGRLSAAVEYLPAWDYGIYECEQDDGSLVEIAGRDVLSSCAGEVTLRDGRVLQERRPK